MIMIKTVEMMILSHDYDKSRLIKSRIFILPSHDYEHKFKIITYQVTVMIKTFLKSHDRQTV